MSAIKKRKWRWKIFVYAVLFLLLAILSYFQFLYKAPRVNSKVFTLERIFQEHSNIVWAVKFSPDGTLLGSAGVDSLVRIRSIRNRSVIYNLKHPAGLTYFVFSEDGKLIATASYDGKIRIWKLPQVRMIREFGGHTGTPWSLAFSPDGKKLVTGGEDGVVNIRNVLTGALLHSIKEHSRTVWAVQYSPDGTKIASGSYDRTVRIRDSSGRLLHILKGHAEAVVSLSFSPDGRTLATTSDDKTIRIWNVQDGSLIRNLKGSAEHVQAVAFSPDGKWLLTGGRDKPGIGEFLQNFLGESRINKGVSMRLWEISSGRILQTFAEHGDDANDVAFSPDGKWIASGSSDRTVHLWKRNEN